MPKPRKLTRLLPVPDANSLHGARLQAFHREKHARHNDFVMDYLEFRPLAAPVVHEKDGQPHETTQGRYAPRRLRFCQVERLEIEGLYNNLGEVPFEHDARSLRGFLHFWAIQGEIYGILLNASPEPAELTIAARRLWQEDIPYEQGEPVTITRNWSPAPAWQVRLVPAPPGLHARYNGDPSSVQINQRWRHRRLFIGDMRTQNSQRPAVQAVLNLSHQPNPWIEAQGAHPADCWAPQGEGSDGMDVQAILSEAQWVIENLHKGKSVLVHCSAGMNRSATICCAALILLENLSAEAALERVRQRHPWARPDSFHWLRLRWLAQQNQR